MSCVLFAPPKTVLCVLGWEQRGTFPLGKSRYFRQTLDQVAEEDGTMEGRKLFFLERPSSFVCFTECSASSSFDLSDVKFPLSVLQGS